MGLTRYLRKRQFDRTPEPKESRRHSPKDKLVFVVHQHHASHQHYDLRLELDGVLKSWAVPKGPSLNPHEHHLAIQTEDHPYDYRKFEGVIPEGNYGAGKVIIWDQGWYEARQGDSKNSQATLNKELKKGHLTFILHGKKLKGEFALIKLHNSPDKDAWLLIKKGDEYATNSDVTTQDESVKSHQRVDEIGQMAERTSADLASYPRDSPPHHIKPMLCTLVDEPFDREGWLFEIKWDGFRAIASKQKDKLELYSRTGNNFLEKYLPIVEAMRSFRHDVIVDGEIVVLDEQGVAHFEWLQNWQRDRHGSLQYYLFDILWCDGHDVRGMPLDSRKELLKRVMPKNEALRYSDDVVAGGLKLFKQMQQRGLEGMVAKRADSPYREDERGPDWLKIKTHLRQEVVIGGYTEPRGSRQHLGSLIVGVYSKGQLIYVGHSGGSIPEEQRRSLRDRLAKLKRRTSPFLSTPQADTPIHWVQPKLVCEMSFQEWTKEGYMRQPQFEGLRPDKKASSVHREVAKHSQPAPAAKIGHTDLPFEPTHLDKVFFPGSGYTKGDVFNYYEAVVNYILPYLKDRPCSLNRMPSGINGESFFQKNNEHLPEWVPTADIYSESNNADLHWIVGKDIQTLLYMVQLGCIEINPWNSRIKHLDNPDWIVIDLDPEGVVFKDVIQVAITVKAVCDEWHIPAHPKTSGKSGIHIYIPMHAEYSYEQGKNLAHLIALEVNKREPKLTSVERLPEKRPHKIYVDFLQNREGQTLVAPYSLRPTPEATVSMPLHWDEIRPNLKPTDFTIKNSLTRLKRTGDLWKPLLERGANLPNILKLIESRARSAAADQ